MELISTENRGCSGIYKITNLINGKVYVGRTRNLYARCSQYISGFRNHDLNRVNEYLMKSVLKHGSDNFEFSIIEFCDIQETEERENYWMDYYNSHDSNFGYNLRRDYSGIMFADDRTKEKISKKLKKQWANGERDGHSEKLKKAWENRDRLEQSRRLSNTLTRYEYLIYFDNQVKIVRHKQLCEMGYGNVVATFHKKSCDDVIFKGVRIVRRLING